MSLSDELAAFAPLVGAEIKSLATRVTAAENRVESIPITSQNYAALPAEQQNDPSIIYFLKD